MVESPNFYIEDGISYRRDYLGNWTSMFDSAQPNPSYVHRPGIHGWIQGENGLERIDIPPGQEVSPVQKPQGLRSSAETAIELTEKVQSE